MAVMFPEEERHHQPESYAERRLYPVFAGLSDEYTVCCNRRWHTPASDGKPAKPAEADFLIAHPDRGILVIEVKGGRIRYDPRTDSWYSNNKRLKESPFAQVQRTRYRLRDVLSGSSIREVEFPLGEAVAFPDVDLSPGDLPTGELPERVIDAGDLAEIDRAVVRAFETFGLAGNEQVFGRRGIHALTATIAGSVELRRNIGGEVAEADAECIRLTENQYETLDALDGNLRLLVIGGAGTGKTRRRDASPPRPCGCSSPALTSRSASTWPASSGGSIGSRHSISTGSAPAGRPRPDSTTSVCRRSQTPSTTSSGRRTCSSRPLRCWGGESTL
jgi:hypothetical protein